MRALLKIKKTTNLCGSLPQVKENVLGAGILTECYSLNPARVGQVADA